MSHADTTTGDAEHAASPFRGVRLGIVALIWSLLWPAWWLTVYLSVRGDTSGSTSVDGGALLLWILLAYLGVPLALVFGVLAVRKNRMLGKVLGTLAIAIALGVIGLQLWGVFVLEGYLPAFG
jgi:hypothetical protein